ncbi:hypothetical protein STEG23_001189 [Scotinomys teguina]
MVVGQQVDIHNSDATFAQKWFIIIERLNYTATSEPFWGINDRPKQQYTKSNDDRPEQQYTKSNDDRPEQQYTKSDDRPEQQYHQVQ